MDDFGDKRTPYSIPPPSRVHAELAKSVMGGEKEEQGERELRAGRRTDDPPGGLMSRSSVRREERALLEAMKPIPLRKRRTRWIGDEARALAACGLSPPPNSGLRKGEGDV